MADSVTNGGRRGRSRGGGVGLNPGHEPENTAPFPHPPPPAAATFLPGTSSHGKKQRLPRSFMIQLTGTNEGGRDSPDNSELLFSLEQEDKDFPSISFSGEKEICEEEEEERGLSSAAFHAPLSSSSPSSPSYPGFLSPVPSRSSSPGQRPLASLVKSLSTELELKDGSTLRPRPLLTLVKSISTEMSRSEPEVSQSKSDSRLNLHLLRQLTQPKARGSGSSCTAPPSPSLLSPSGDSPRAGFFKIELEDTKRKLSEVVQEPLSSMLSKIRREDSPKHLCGSPAARPFSQQGSLDAGGLDSPVRSAKRLDNDLLSVYDWPYVRPPRRSPPATCPVHHARPSNREEELENSANGNEMQAVTVATHKRMQSFPFGPPLSSRAPPATRPVPAPHPAVPRMSLFCMALLSYSYLVLPLSSYLSGLVLGLALGFLLGLLFIQLGSSRSHLFVHTDRPTQMLPGPGTGAANTTGPEPDVLKGWVNEINEYNPESHHPCLTHSVFASLEGSCLRLDYPSSNISRHAALDEKLHDIPFAKSLCFQLANSKVFLLPSILARKRMWNPKYPICIQLVEGAVPQEEERGTGESPLEQPPSTPVPPSPAVLYLFGRTGREKEEWFRRLLSASRCTEREEEEEEEGKDRAGTLNPGAVPSGSPSGLAQGSTEYEGPSVPSPPSMSSSISGLSLLDYPSYMSRLLATDPQRSPFLSSTETSPTIRGKCTCDIPESPAERETAWANALIGRIFWDFLREKHWADLVSNKIQKKLGKIRLPYFMNELTLTELDMGSSVPQITSTSRPEVNRQGLWLEVELVYTGALQMSLQTKLNLCKLGKEGGQDPDCLTDTSSQGGRPVLSVLADSDEESSSAGSSDEEEVLLSEPQGPLAEKGATPGADGAAGRKTGRKILRFMDKIAKSKYFQKATENEFIKKKIEEMSNTPLLLTVEVQELSGMLVINIPPPPTDRIWYSFSVPPKLDLRVRPKLGEREVTFCHVTEWIEKKLQDKFQKVFVLPNMDDIRLPLMHSGMESPLASKQPSSQSIRSQHSSTESVTTSPAEMSEVVPCESRQRD